jgi:hypothetical protein
MRGSSLFSDFFDTETLPQKQRKGRSPELIEKRNDLLIHRYVFYSTLPNRLNYEYIITRLSEELHLSPITIPQIIEDNQGKIVALRRQEPSRQYFQKKYPYLVWDAKSLLMLN